MNWLQRVILYFESGVWISAAKERDGKALKAQRDAEFQFLVDEWGFRGPLPNHEWWLIGSSWQSDACRIVVGMDIEQQRRMVVTCYGMTNGKPWYANSLHLEHWAREHGRPWPSTPTGDGDEFLKELRRAYQVSAAYLREALPIWFPVMVARGWVEPRHLQPTAADIPGIANLPMAASSNPDTRWADLVVDIHSRRSDISTARSALREYLDKRPDLVVAWLAFSESKRTSSGQFFRKTSTGYEVGEVGVSGAIHLHSQGLSAAEACAEFIVRELKTSP